MMRRCLPIAVLLVLPLLLLVGPVQAQEADTTETDTSVTDTSVMDTSATDTTTTDEPTPDTSQAVASDTTAAEETAPADTAQGTADTDGLATDTTMQADAEAASTLSSEERRAQAEKQAQAAAASWLSLTDAGKFGESWDAAAPVLQEGISREQWRKRGARVRSKLDTLTARTLMGTQYRDSTRQIPGGQPVVALQYETEFAGGSVLEAVITTKRADDWAVAGYRVVPNPKSTPASDSTQVPDSAHGQPGTDSTQTSVPPDSTQSPPADSTEGESP